MPVSLALSLMREYRAVPLLDSKYIIPALQDKFIFIDHGLWSQDTHKLLHNLKRSIFFFYNVDALASIENGYILFSKLNDMNKSEVLKIIGEVEDIPYTLNNYVARHLLWEMPLMDARKQFVMARYIHGDFSEGLKRGNELYPFGDITDEDIDKFVKKNNIELTGNEFGPNGFNGDKIKEMVIKALENRKMEQEFEKTKDNLKAWGYLD